MFIISKLDVINKFVTVLDRYDDRKEAVDFLFNSFETHKKVHMIEKIKDKNLIKLYEKGYMYNTLIYIFQIIEVK